MTSKRKLFNECFNAVMASALAFAAMLLIQLAFQPHLSSWSGVLYMIPLILCYPAGRMFHSRKTGHAIPLGIVLSLCLSAISLALDFYMDVSWFIRLLLTPALGFFLFCIPYINGENLLHPSQFFAGTGMFLACSVISYLTKQTEYTAPVNITAVIFLIVGLFVFNNENVRLETSPDRKRTKFPIGIRQNNTLLLILFIGLALLLTNFGAVRQFFIDAFFAVVMGIMLFMNWIGSLMGITTPQGGNVSSGQENIGIDGEYTTESSFVQTLWQIVLILIIVGIIVALIYLIVKFGKYFAANFKGWIEKFFKKIQPEDAAYVDETEDLRDKSNIREDIANRLKELAEKFKRQPRFDDMPNNREKVRFAFKSMLGRMKGKNRVAEFRTPNELKPDADRLIPQMSDEFIRIYNLARYSNADISDSDADLARKVNNKV